MHSVPEDATRTSVILDGATYQRLAQAARSRPKLIREQEIEESKRNRDAIEVYSIDHLVILNQNLCFHLG